jgi:hypothetical protein
MMRLSMNRSIKSSNLCLMGADGTVIEINSQGSLENTPEKKRDDFASKESNDFDDNLAHLVFTGQELANSFEATANYVVGQQTTMLSTRSENEEERVYKF